MCAGACEALLAGRAHVDETDGSFNRRLIGQGGQDEERRSRGGRTMIGRMLLASTKSERERTASSGGAGEHDSVNMSEHDGVSMMA